MQHTFDLKNLSIPECQGLLQSLVVPRPIALASTVDKAGNVNLSPFSFFNLFGLNPPVVVFSPSRRGRDATTKHTLENVLEVPEVVINIVNHRIVEQTSLASVEYEKGVDEFGRICEGGLYAGEVGTSGSAARGRKSGQFGVPRHASAVAGRRRRGG